MKTIAVTVQEFDAAYWKSRPLEIQKAHAEKVEHNDLDQTVTYTALAIAGFIIDKPIMIDNMGPYNIMLLRLAYGFTWVPSALMPNIQIAPGLGGLPGSALYDPSKPPPGSILVSLDLKDYPPVNAPEPNHPSVSTALVGVQSFGNIYLAIPGDTSPGGTVFEDSRGKFIKHTTIQLGGTFTYYWELIGSAPAPSTLPTVPDPMLPK